MTTREITTHAGHAFWVVVDRDEVDFDYMPAEQLARLPYGAKPADVAAVHVRRYRCWEFGPTADVFFRDGHVSWLTFPGGMDHSAWYDDDAAAERRAALDAVLAGWSCVAALASGA